MAAQVISNNKDLTEGSITGGMLSFAIPLFIGQLLQQLYSITDAWVIGHFSTNEAFAAVNSSGSLNFLIVGFFSGLALGGGVIISTYFGAKDKEKVERSIHNNFILGIISSVLCTLIGLFFAPKILMLMRVPPEVLPESIAYFRITFLGVTAVIMYNVGMSIMRALGDSIRPMIYLVISTVTNIILDIVFVAVFDLGVSGVAYATVIAQALSAPLCIIKLSGRDDYTKLSFKKLKWDSRIMWEIVAQGLPAGIQNAVISIGNITVQSNVNSFGTAAMSGYGAYVKVEGFVFLPITSMSMTIPTFVSQNLGAGKDERAKKGARFGILSGMAVAESIGLIFFAFAGYFIRFFIEDPAAISYGVTHSRITALFFFLLAFSHCAAGALRGCGKAYIPMITMLSFWCGVRVLYVTQTIKFIPKFAVISWAYPLTWTLSSIVFLICIFKLDWKKVYRTFSVLFAMMIVLTASACGKASDQVTKDPGFIPGSTVTPYVPSGNTAGTSENIKEEDHKNTDEGNKLQVKDEDCENNVPEDILPISDEIFIEAGTKELTPYDFVTDTQELSKAVITIERVLSAEELSEYGEEYIVPVTFNGISKNIRVHITDTIAPVLGSAEDLTVKEGGTLALKRAVTFTDNSSGEIRINVVSKGGLDYNTPGIYTVTYTAEDEAGNASEPVSITVTVTAISEKEKTVTELAEKIIEAIKNENPEATTYELLFRLWNFCRTEITWNDVETDRSSIYAGAYEGIVNGKGDCFVYYATFKLFLDTLGIENETVTRVGGTSRHWWNLVKVEDGWYHADPSPRNKKHNYFCFLQTDAQIAAYTEFYSEHPDYYTFDETGLPERSKTIIFDGRDLKLDITKKDYTKAKETVKIGYNYYDGDHGYVAGKHGVTDLK